jgi:hypothetical protein
MRRGQAATATVLDAAAEENIIARLGDGNPATKRGLPKLSRRRAEFLAIDRGRRAAAHDADGPPRPEAQDVPGGSA